MKGWTTWVTGLALFGCAVGSVSPLVRDFRGAWFTNVDRISGDYSSPPEMLYPEVTVFERGKDAKVTLCVVFNSGDTHLIRVILKQHGGWTGQPLEVTTRPVVMAAARRWRVDKVSWPTDRLEAGQYTVDLTVDAVLMGSYSFTIK